VAHLCCLDCDRWSESRKSSLGRAKACSNHDSGSRAKVIRLFATAVLPRGKLLRHRSVSQCRSLTCGTTAIGRFTDPPKRGVRIEHDLCSMPHLSSSGSTMLPWNLTLPESFGDLRISVGTTLATGLPRLVTVRRVRATLSRSAKQCALNSPAGTVLGCMLIVRL
jgi:hypothetical protein